MTSGNLYFNGVQIDGTDEYGSVVIFPGSIDDAPPRVQSVADIPKNNGGVIIDEGRYKNLNHSYGVIITGVDADGAAILRHRLVNRLCGSGGYKRLSDSFHVNEFYEAYLSDGITFTPDDLRKSYKGVLNFYRKPQRFLTAGEEPIETIESWNREDITIVNPYMPAKPIIKLTRADGYTNNPNFTMNMSGGSVRITGTVGTWVEIDTERMSYRVQSSGSSTTVTFNGKPVIPTGESTITFTGSNPTSWLGGYEVTPRWWRL